jgi:hypothetical protein
MKRPWLGWLFYGLAALVVIGYILNGGLYSGSSLDFTGYVDGKPTYNTVCHYLFLNGARDEVTSADRRFCPPLHP